MRILTICPTRNRSELCSRMLKSFMETKSEGTDIVFSLDDDEIQYQEYKNLFGLYNVNFFELMPASITEHINHLWQAFPDYDYYHITNDDIEYKTPEWDKKLIIQKDGIFYGNDLLQGDKLPTFPIISTGIATALGWLQCPYVAKYFGDTIWGEIGIKTGCLHYNSQVIIEHHHPLASKRQEDNPIYDRQYKDDYDNFVNWVVRYSILDKRKVRKCLNSK